VSAKATAGWRGAAFVNVSHCLAAITVSTSSAGPVTQPTFQPVNENVLPALEMLTVRSHMPGSVQSGTCVRPSNTRCS
jgi:hypothetical protein